jgi:DNA-binding NtrC family response regulator
VAKTRILVVDDEEGMLEVCADTLQKLADAEGLLEQHSVAAAKRIAADNFDILITDLSMPELNGMDLLWLARQHDPNLAAVILTAFPTVETAVESMKLGAAD